MANNVNQNAISNGVLHTLDGVECVRWAVDSFAHENLTAARFKELNGIMTLASQNGGVTCEIVNIGI